MTDLTTEAIERDLPNAVRDRLARDEAGYAEFRSGEDREVAEAYLAAHDELLRLRHAVQIVREAMNTQANGGTGWMAEFERLLNPEKTNDQ